HLTVLLKKFVKQHRVHRIVAHCVNLAVLIVHHEVRVYLSNLLGNQTEFRSVCVVVLVVKRYWLKCQDCFTGFVHRFNLLLESPRGTDRAQLALGVDQHGYGVVLCRCLPANLANKTAVAHVLANGADTDSVIGCGDGNTGAGAQSRVTATSAAKERTSADGGVGVAAGVAKERFPTSRCVLDADSVAKKGECSIGRAFRAGGVA